MAAIAPETRRQIVEARLSGRTAKEIARGFGISKVSVEQNWRKWAESFGIQLPTGYVRKKKDHPIPKVPPAVWSMRAWAVRIRLEGYNSAQAAIESGLRLQDIRINWRAWAEHLGIEPPPALTKEQLMEELSGDDPDPEALEPILNQPQTNFQEETTMSEANTAKTYTVKEFPVSAAFEILRSIFEPSDITDAEMHCTAPDCCNHIEMRAALDNELVEITLKVRPREVSAPETV